MKTDRSLIHRLGLVIILGMLQGCMHLALEDCGSDVLGTNEPRIRSSHFRMLLSDLSAASSRFAPFAAMSALAYAEEAACGSGDPKLTTVERASLQAALLTMGWRESKEVAWTPPCEDTVGLYFRVWTLDAETKQVVVAFRGTWGFKDWLYGNLHWVTRFLPMDDQYSKTRTAMKQVFERFPDTPQKSTRFYTTGHSLGGGLAQHALYSYPYQIEQAFAFDPSSVTGFADQPASNQVAGCQCDSSSLYGEPRIFRIYDAYEILSNLRIFHKIFFSPERHIQEVRFPNDASHSMTGLAFYLLKNASLSGQSSKPWYAGKGDYTAAETCTMAFIRTQRSSCQAVVDRDQWNYCPR